MKKCPPRSSKSDEVGLEFPAAPDFSRQAPRINPQVMLERIAQTMAVRKKPPGEDARRAAEKIPVEFVL
jgi:hypothetical protein